MAVPFEDMHRLKRTEHHFVCHPSGNGTSDWSDSLKTACCERCGEYFQTKGRYAKYCSACKPIVYKQYKHKKKKEVDPNSQPKLIMRPEYIAICLNCLKKTCNGHCNLLPDYHGS